MYITTREIIYPEGDKREIEHILRLNQLVDLNGFPVQLPLPGSKIIIYRVRRKSTETHKGGEIVQYFLELVKRDELEEFVE